MMAQATTQPLPACSTCWFVRGVRRLDEPGEAVAPRAAALRRLIATKACLGSSRGHCPLT
jgi:hypothetical protein